MNNNTGTSVNASANILSFGLGWFPTTPGGMDRYVYELMQQLAAAGDRIDLCGMGLPAISPDPAIWTRIAPGLLQYLRLLPQEGALASDKWRASLQGRWQGWQTWKQTRFAEFGKDSP